MILEVDEVGYADAVEALRAGNHAAADIVARLTTQLAGTGRMAGTDTGAAEFAAAYDAAADQTLHTLTDATRALATLGRTTAACDTRHRDAERAAITPGAILDPGCTPPPTDSWLAPLPTTPPTALGGDDPGLSDHENWILDQVGGILWPDGSPTRLRTAATAWRTTAESVHGLADTLTVAADALHTQRSPEIPLAIAACHDVRSVLLEVGDQCTALATQCDQHATAIETAHDALRALLAEVLMMVVEGMVVSAALAAVSAGAGAAAGLATIAARVAATAPRFHHILTLLRTARTATTTALRTTHTALTTARARLTRFLRVPVRGERGAIRVLPGRPNGWLAGHEHSGSHTLARHVGKTVEELRAREPMPFRASSFRSQADAERILDQVLRRQKNLVDEWLTTTRGHLRLEDSMPYDTGISVLRDGPASRVSGVRVILRRDATMPDGFRIHTAFPQP